MQGDLSEIEVIIEIPKGCRNKYEYDPERKLFRLDRRLFSSVHYPSDYGFVPGTLAEDEDPLDAMVLISEPTFPGCLIQSRPIGLFKMKDEKGLDHKILCVPIKDPEWNHIHRSGRPLPTFSSRSSTSSISIRNSKAKSPCPKVGKMWIRPRASSTKRGRDMPYTRCRQLAKKLGDDLSGRPRSPSA